MSADPTAPPRRRPSALHAPVSLSVAAVGLGLLLYTVSVEGEPGAVPLLLVAAGVGWYVAARVRARRG